MVEETEGKKKDAFVFIVGGSASQSEAEQQVRQRQMDRWNPGRPAILELLVDSGKRQRNT